MLFLLFQRNKMKLIFIFLLSTSLLLSVSCEEEKKSFNDEIAKYRQDAQDPEAVVYSDDVIAEQRNYQPGLNSNFNLDLQSEPYGIEFKYHDFDQMTKFLRATSSKFPSLTALYSIGKSIQGNFVGSIISSNNINFFR